MTGRPARQNLPQRQIRGPQSALTDFLASQNISASRIRADADARRNAALAVNQGNADAEAATEDATEDEEVKADPPNSSTSRVQAQAQKRKKEAQAIEKIKKSKTYKNQKRRAEDSDSDDLARAMYQEKSVPLPGQMDNCEICDKRFTVTPYSRAGPNGGLLCTKCSKELAKDDGPAKKKTKKAAPSIGGRRKVQSRILDGTYSVGAKSLMALCIEMLSKNIDLADDLGDLPHTLIDRIARMLSKRRLMTPNTLNLFLQSEVEDIPVYDGSKLGSDDYIRIFQISPKLKRVKLRNAIQFKDEVMRYLIGRNLELESFYLHGANLVSADVWKEYLEAKGKHLKELQVYYTDKHFNDDVIASLKEHCPNLKRLKVTHNQQVTDEGVKHIAEMGGLEHLGLQLLTHTTTEPLITVVSRLGQGLRTLSLRGMFDMDDRLLVAIHDNCRSLSKLRITESEIMTDAAFVRLFKDWANKPLTYIDFQKCRHVNSARPRENPHLVGLCSDGFRALMAHSGKAIRQLNVHACRNISQQTFEDVFSIDNVYPELVKMEISFCEEVTDFVVGCIFRSCPKLTELNVFGCMKVKEVRVPRGKLLVGVPTAMGMTIEGYED